MSRVKWRLTATVGTATGVLLTQTSQDSEMRVKTKSLKPEHFLNHESVTHRLTTCYQIYNKHLLKYFHFVFGFYIKWCQKNLILIRTTTTWWAGRAQSLRRLHIGWTVRGSNPGGGVKFSTPDQIGPGAHPAF